MKSGRAWSRLAAFGFLTLTLGALGFRASGETPQPSIVFAASTSSGTIGGVSFANEDVLAYDEGTGTWSLHMDGSAVGISESRRIDAFHVVGDERVLFSLSASANLQGLGTVDDSDVVELDVATSGLSLYFDGSTHGLTTAGEDVDAITLDQDGRLILSITGSGSVPAGAVADEDLLRLVEGNLELFLDGSAVGLSSSAEDIVGVSLAPGGEVEVTTLGNFSTGGLVGTRSDIARCEPTSSGPIVSCQWTVRWLAAANGFQAESLNGVSISGPSNPPTTTTTTTSSTTTTTTSQPTTTTTSQPTTTTTLATTTTTTVPPPIVEGSLFLASTTDGAVGGVAFTDEDVVAIDQNGLWSIYLDGSDLGIPRAREIDGFAIGQNGAVLFSLNAPTTLPGVGPVDDSDVIRFEPTSLGQSTAGVLSMEFDGSAYGLTTSAENVDAVGLDRDGNLLISTRGSAAGPFGTAADEDVLVFDGSGLSLFLDGSALGLNSSSENVNGISVNESGVVHISTLGGHSVAGAFGDRSDVLQCMPMVSAPITECAWINYWDGGQNGFGAETVGAVNTTAIVGYYNDFDRPLGPEWEIYHSIGHAGWGLRRPSAVSVGADQEAGSGGLLAITAQMGTGDEAGQLVSGGIKARHPQTYGTYLVRVKVEPDPDGVTSGAVLLWPESNQHPRDGEIDILESWTNRETRTPVESNLHWLRPGAVPPYTLADDLKAQVVHPGIDGTLWHVFELEWRENLVSVAVDGGTPVVLSTDPAEIASWNMEPTIQLDAFDAFDAPGVQPTLSGPVTMSVDYLIARP